MKRLVLWLVRLTLFMSLFWSGSASAYPWMLRNEYASCNQCHADPSGGGLLTQYGRAQGVILLSSHYKKGAEEEDPGSVGDFLFGAIKLPEDGALLLQTDHRLAGLVTRNLKSGDGDERFLLMQTDLAGQVTIADRFRVNGNVGVVNSGARPAAITTDSALGGEGFAVVSRTHWLGVDLGKDKDYTLRLGRLNMPYGIRSLEHTRWVRTASRTDFNSAQQYGIAIAHSEEKFRFEAMGVLGNFAVAPDLYRERGFVGFAEWFAKPNLVLGASSLLTYAGGSVESGKQQPTRRQAHGLMMRWSPSKPLVLSSEVDLLYGHTISESKRYGIAAVLQADIEPWQGLHILAAAEAKNPAFEKFGMGVGGWAGVQWFFLPHVDFRSDLIFRSEDVGASSRLNTFAYMGQLHAYL